ncbi:MAG: hypothetical protein AAGK05_09735, partial [Pseudomonadota bacterium]
MEIGRKSLMREALLHFGTGMMLAALKHPGTVPSERDLLKILVMTGARTFLKSRKIHEGIPSGPQEVFFTFERQFSTSTMDSDGKQLGKVSLRKDAGMFPPS